MQLSALAVRPLLIDIDLNLDHAQGSDATISLSSECDYFNITNSITSYDNASEIPKQTEAKAVDDDDGGEVGALSPAYGPLRSEQNQKLGKFLLPAEICTSKDKVVHGACVNDQPGDRGIVETASGVALKDEDQDPLAVKIDQRIGSGRYGDKHGNNDTAQSPRTEEANNCESNEDSSLVKGSRMQTKSAFEATEMIQRVERLSVLADLATSSHSPGIKKSSVAEPFAAIVDNLMPVKHLCATEDRPLPTEPQWRALSSLHVSNIARQTQVHELNGEIHRLIPPDRIICFGVDENSFKCGGVPQEVTMRIISAADGIAQLIGSKRLRIKFEYRPGSASNVFNIRYDPNLGLDTLAHAFFPSDSRKTWQLRISKSVAFSEAGESGYLDYIPNILAHEFAHILGLRHWNAGFDLAELREPSVLWPETIERSRLSVMNTGVHPNHMRFSEEDFRVISEIYSFANGDFYAGRKIVDVDPYAVSYKL